MLIDHSKDKKKKCTEERPSCQRCVERQLECHYEPVQPRKRRRTPSTAGPSEPIASASTSPSIGPLSRAQLLHHDSNDTSPIPTPALRSNSLSIPGSWDAQSVYSDSASQYTSDYTPEPSVSPVMAGGFQPPSMR